MAKSLFDAVVTSNPRRVDCLEPVDERSKLLWNAGSYLPTETALTPDDLNFQRVFWHELYVKYSEVLPQQFSHPEKAVFNASGETSNT
jgi:hypothetical protein